MTPATLPGVSREAFVQNLVACGAERSRAEARAEQVYGPPRIELEPEDQRALEKATQRDVANLFRAFGGIVYNLSQPRATKQAPGLPDLYVFFPRERHAIWWETKRPVGGKLSPAQVEFQEFCDRCDVPWDSGCRADAEEWLIARGIAERAELNILEPVRP